MIGNVNRQAIEQAQRALARLLDPHTEGEDRVVMHDIVNRVLIHCGEALDTANQINVLVARLANHTGNVVFDNAERARLQLAAGTSEVRAFQAIVNKAP